MTTEIHKKFIAISYFMSFLLETYGDNIIAECRIVPKIAFIEDIRCEFSLSERRLSHEVLGNREGFVEVLRNELLTHNLNLVDRGHDRNHWYFTINGLPAMA